VLSNRKPEREKRFFGGRGVRSAKGPMGCTAWGASAVAPARLGR